MSDTFLFADETDESTSQSDKDSWKVLIVDDEPEIHQVTKLVVSGFSFDGKAVDLISAFSAAEAKQLLTSAHPNEFALAIVDVVMESNHAGLELVQWIRDELNNRHIRLVLRTGQPGQAPEESVIRDYDLNDYKNKTELTALRLKTLFYSALRGYRDILMIEKHRIGLEKVINATSQFIECDTLPQFASAILNQVAVVLGIESQHIVCCAATKESYMGSEEINLLAANDIKVPESTDVSQLPENLKTRIKEALKQRQSVTTDAYFVGYFTTKRGTENILYVSLENGLNPSQNHLLEFFANNIAVTYENLKLRELIKESQKELSYVVGEAVEMRSKETGSHVKRVAHISHKLAELYGLDPLDAEMIKLASPLHDVGKVGIPDAVLNKPGKHTEDEWQIMKTHAEIGFEMLTKSDNPILRLGATIAHQHHEKWDGSGYPQGLQGNQIDIVGRITAIADVFDALGSKRCYKPAWNDEDIFNFIQTEKGKHFEPRLVDLLMQHSDEFFAIRERFPDPDETH